MSEQRVLLRIKRKRTDDPVEKLMVQSHLQVHFKKSKLEDAIGSLSIKTDATSTEAKNASASDSKDSNDTKAEKPISMFLFSRIDTVSNTNDYIIRQRLEKSTQKHHQNRVKKSTTPIKTRSTIDKQRKDKRSKRVAKGRGLNLVDVALPTSSSSSKTLTIQVNGEELRAKALKRVMNPMERQIDEAIWTAFQKNDFSIFFRVLQQPQSNGLNSLLFQRPADGGSILMAAAMHNRIDVIECLLAMDSKMVILRDYNSKSAANIAADQGHQAAASALRACEVVEDDKEYVYDVYSIDIAGTKQLPANTESSPTPSLENIPVVEVNTSVEKWLMYEATDMDSDTRELIYDDVNDSDEEVMHEDDEDSNDEGYIRNDYPDEVSSEEETEHAYDSDISDEWQAAWKRNEVHTSDTYDPWSTHKADYEEDGDY
ncbi:hypothetical protein THRCLA_04940 [Thraustotheca clavata]|uniref:Probable RNA polymerase II nuclear localization protein SLC7A6OS n=1 Tax=Thraustotheca clavata TaxID=74557 RepID=A0A1V9ZXJ1_9STRA|nr:hypothetical protein THRCLA_04940 [Thraustotheca clavata]